MKSFNEERINMKLLFQNVPGMISFALDVWTSPNVYSFLAITAHWITKEWELKETLIDFCKLVGPHTGENLAEAFVNCINEFNIVTKVSKVYYLLLPYFAVIKHPQK